ncbi:MAG: hypothetical protein R3F17_12525 [Planctomycetota bacterium]
MQETGSKDADRPPRHGYTRWHEVQRSKKRGVYAATVVGLWLVSGCWLTSAQPGSKTQRRWT